MRWVLKKNPSKFELQRLFTYEMDESKSIRTERLLLRGARENDLDDFHAMLTNDEVMKYWYDCLNLINP